jgi:hypothetical protein
VADDLKLKGPVREIGIIRDRERHDSFNIMIGITIKTEGKVSYEEAERLSTKFRREYLGKDVEFRAIHIPCPHCDKVLNSETGLKQHILKVHPEKAELLKPPSVAKTEKTEKKIKVKKTVKAKKAKHPIKRVTAVKASKTASVKKPKQAKSKSKPRNRKSSPALEPPKPVKSKATTSKSKVIKEPAKVANAKQSPKAKQLTLA